MIQLAIVVLLCGFNVACIVDFIAACMPLLLIILVIMQFVLCSVTGNSSAHGYQQSDTH